MGVRASIHADPPQRAQAMRTPDGPVSPALASKHRRQDSSPPTGRACTDVLRLQRTVGNRATAALIQRACSCSGSQSCTVVEPEPVFRQHPVLRSFTPPTEPLAVSRTDVVQGAIAACPIAAVMVATAHARPARIRTLLGPAVPGVALSSRSSDEIFRHWSDVTYCVSFTRGGDHTVTPVVYFDDDTTVTYASTPSGPGWPSLIEKAYAIFRGANSYARLDMGTTLIPVPDAQTVLTDVVGPSDMAHIAGGRFFPDGGTDRALTNADLIAMARRAPSRPTIAASLTTGTTAGVVANHAYAVLRFSGNRIDLRNPWGGAGAEISLSVAQLNANFQAVWQAL